MSQQYNVLVVDSIKKLCSLSVIDIVQDTKGRSSSV